MRQVPKSPDLDRIASLPTQSTGPVPVLPDGLRPVQRQALIELHRCRGLYGGIVVGGGKSLLSLLTPTVLGVRRWVWLIPASLRSEMLREIGKWAKIYDFPRPHIVSHQELSSPQSQFLLDNYMPELICIDEVSEFSPNSARTRRLSRYLQQHQPYVVALTGTPLRNRLLDMSIALGWALREGSPLPLDPKVTAQWDSCVTSKTSKWYPGALSALMTTHERQLACHRSTARGAARAAILRRIRHTPGVILSSQCYDDVPLVLRRWDMAMPQEIRDALQRLRKYAELPDGQPLADPLEIHRASTQLIWGCWLSWTQSPPPDWLEARRRWFRVLRSILAKQLPHLDSPRLVTDWVRTLPTTRVAHQVLLRWESVCDEFIPETKLTWYSTKSLECIIQWIRSHPRGIVWCPVPLAGKRLARMAQVRYFGRQGLASDGTHVMDAAGGPVILSEKANYRGRNLQHYWCDNLFPAPSASGTFWEQALGRTMRTGQTRTVSADIWLEHSLQSAAWRKALDDAEIEDQLIGSAAKLNNAIKEM